MIQGLAANPTDLEAARNIPSCVRGDNDRSNVADCQIATQRPHQEPSPPWGGETLLYPVELDVRKLHSGIRFLLHV